MMTTVRHYRGHIVHNDDELCDCGNKAVWLYMPGHESGFNPLYCDDCVPRGCSCNTEYLPAFEPDIGSNPPSGDDWTWLEENKSWEYVDDHGRRYPCCEFLNFAEDS